MLNEISDKIVERIMDELDNRSMFNDIDGDIVEEIRESLYDIVTKEIL